VIPNLAFCRFSRKTFSLCIVVCGSIDQTASSVIFLSGWWGWAWNIGGGFGSTRNDFRICLFSSFHSFVKDEETPREAGEHDEGWICMVRMNWSIEINIGV